MASIYDSIKTPRELLEKVKAHGLSTATEDICRAQDIFGNAPICDLAALANDNGRRNDKKEPDPKGNWASGKEGMQSTFYFVLFSIWNWEEATRFYNQHTNPEYEELKNLKNECKSLRTRIEQLETRRDELLEDAKRGSDFIIEQSNRIQEAEKRAETAEAEVIQLKAKLYDLMVERK